MAQGDTIAQNKTFSAYEYATGKYAQIVAPLDQVPGVGTGAATIVSGRKTVTNAGTAVRVSTDAQCKYVVITAETDNTGIICIGDSGVKAALATRTGIPLGSGDTIILELANLNDLYMDSTVSGDGATILYAL